MATQEVLKVTCGEDEINISVREDNICVYNSETDARAWCFLLSISDWDAVKEYIEERIEK